MEDKLLSKLNNIIEKAMSNALEENSPERQPQYANPDEYRKATGKRFRMTRDQKERGISRDEAFAEFLQKNQGNS